MRVLTSLDEAADLLATWSGPDQLYVRWTPHVAEDCGRSTSRDALTGVDLPGLSANSLAVEDWWGDRPLRLWVARRLYDYRHLAEDRGSATVPWIIAGREVGRGPDNEPLIGACTTVARLDAAVVDEAVREVEALPAGWGTLRRAE